LATAAEILSVLSNIRSEYVSEIAVYDLSHNDAFLKPKPNEKIIKE